MAYQPANRTLPAIVIDHPTQMVAQEVLRQRAIQIADAVGRLLDDREP